MIQLSHWGPPVVGNCLKLASPTRISTPSSSFSSITYSTPTRRGSWFGGTGTGSGSSATTTRRRTFIPIPYGWTSRRPTTGRSLPCRSSMTPTTTGRISPPSFPVSTREVPSTLLSSTAGCKTSSAPIPGFTDRRGCSNCGISANCISTTSAAQNFRPGSGKTNRGDSFLGKRTGRLSSPTRALVS